MCTPPPPSTRMCACVLCWGVNAVCVCGGVHTCGGVVWCVCVGRECAGRVFVGCVRTLCVCVEGGVHIMCVWFGVCMCMCVEGGCARMLYVCVCVCVCVVGCARRVCKLRTCIVTVFTRITGTQKNYYGLQCPLERARKITLKSKCPLYYGVP